MLYIIATPIGNLDDFTPRACRALREADVLACEDTRRTRILLSHYEIPRPPVVLSYREQTEARAADQVAAYLEEGRTVALCTDSGYPGISDPGYRILRLATRKGLDLEVIPGAGAVPLALLYSGLPTSSYCFKGFAPRKKGPLKRFFEDERDRPHTLVFFESPFRTAAALACAYEMLGDREAAVCIELTKKFERIARGYLGELSREFADTRIKGEVTIVIAGNNPKFKRQADV